MSAHKHAENMRLYSEDALETETPQDRWECRLPDEVKWTPFHGSHPFWSNDYEYRRKPKTITVNGIELPAPYRGKMEQGQKYYYTANPAWPREWDNDRADKMWMEYGQLHLTREAAQKWQDAIKKITS